MASVKSHTDIKAKKLVDDYREQFFGVNSWEFKKEFKEGDELFNVFYRTNIWNWALQARLKVGWWWADV